MRLAAQSRTALRMIAIACLVLLALAATALAVSPAARDALRDLFDIGGVTIETTTAPAPNPRGGAPTSGSGQRSARRAPGSASGPLVPAALGHPDATFADPAGTGAGPRLPSRPAALPATTTTGVGLLVTELPGRIAGEYLHKVAVQATTVDRLRVGGRRAAWIAGAPHFFFFGRGTPSPSSHSTSPRTSC